MGQLNDIRTFLEERINEDEAFVNAILNDRPDNGSLSRSARHLVEGNSILRDYVVHFGPYRMQHEIEGKRMILEMYDYSQKIAANRHGEPLFVGRSTSYADVLIDMARAYQQHPDYDSDWMEL